MKLKQRVVAVSLSALLVLSPLSFTSCGERSVYCQIIDELNSDVGDFQDSAVGQCLNIHYGKVGEEYIVGVKTTNHTRFS